VAPLAASAGAAFSTIWASSAPYNGESGALCGAAAPTGARSLCPCPRLTPASVASSTPATATTDMAPLPVFIGPSALRGRTPLPDPERSAPEPQLDGRQYYYLPPSHCCRASPAGPGYTATATGPTVRQRGVAVAQLTPSERQPQCICQPPGQRPPRSAGSPPLDPGGKLGWNRSSRRCSRTWLRT
jgi:hypothetical protein